MVTVHVIAACTDRKRLVAPRRRQMRSIHAHDLERRFEAWKKVIASKPAETTRVSNLYCGDHWSIARRLSETVKSRGWAVRLWVSSAGYGLVPEDAEIGPYSATFAPGQPDSVATGDPSTWRDQVRRWWGYLGTLRDSDQSLPRGVTELVKTSPGAVVIVGSDLYVDAMEDDLIGSREALPHPDQLIVVSSRPRRTTALSANWIETNARLRQGLGGAVGSLNVRVARHILRELEPDDFSANSARELIAGLLREASALPIYDRRPCTDAEVMAFIRNAMKHDATVCHSPLLRKLRSSGFQCEQGRFRGLFESVSRET